MNITIFATITSEDKSRAVKQLIAQSTPSQDFYLMVALATSMATIGLLLDSASIIIGSMLISPMLYAFLSLSLGLSISDPPLMARSASSMIRAVIGGILMAALITIFTPHTELGPEILSRIEPSLAYGVVALIAGFVAAFTLTKPQLSETLPGIAIAVAVIPPLAVAGIGLAHLDWEVMRGSLMLFALNTVAIVAGSLVVFQLMNIYAEKSEAQRALKEETKKSEAVAEAVANKAEADAAAAKSDQVVQ